MRYVEPSRQAWVLAAAFAAGMLAGFAPAQQIAGQLFGRAGIGNAVIVNLVLPVVALAVGVWFPRLGVALVCGAFVAIGFVIARLLLVDVRVWTWGPQFLRTHLSPIAVGATVGCAIVAGLGAVAGGRFRRVGAPPHVPGCPRCGHALAAERQVPLSNRCPECGAPIDHPETATNVASR
ncbi:MAG: hypothetical protein U0572_04295 [Phycisphaerales bacterium]